MDENKERKEYFLRGMAFLRGIVHVRNKSDIEGYVSVMCYAMPFLYPCTRDIGNVYLN